jgi:hypothetical protein
MTEGGDGDGRWSKVADFDLAERLSYWQKVLRLQDWTVEILFKKHFEATHDHCEAYVEVYEPKKHARINLIDPGHINPEGWPKNDQETALVHELLHLHLWPFNPEEDTPKWTAMEQATHALSLALIELERKNG